MSGSSRRGSSEGSTSRSRATSGSQSNHRTSATRCSWTEAGRRRATRCG